jgi:hypothetical protein
MLPHAMMSFSDDPRVAEQQMHAIIFYLTAFGYIDGDFDLSEKQFVRDYIRQLVEHRVGGLGQMDAAQARDFVTTYTAHFHKVFEHVDYEIRSLFTECVSRDENVETFVYSKLKLHCFEIFKAFDGPNQQSLLGTVDELIMADGVAHPSEQRFRDEVRALLKIDTPPRFVVRSAMSGGSASGEIGGSSTIRSGVVAKASGEIGSGRVSSGVTPVSSGEIGSGPVRTRASTAPTFQPAPSAAPRPATSASPLLVEGPVHMPPIMENHAFFAEMEQHWSADPSRIRQQVQVDHRLVKATNELFARQRQGNEGRLVGKQRVDEIFGMDPFLDDHVYALPTKPGKNYELTVLGDLHGCYSCLKAALVQADFFRKVHAFWGDPDNNPDPKLVLLGDYIDRGIYSFNGVLRAAMQLFVAMPEHVYVLRGNHEFYVEHGGRLRSGVAPAEAIATVDGIMPEEMLHAYKDLFESMPHMLLFDRTLFVHAGIPRDELVAARWTGLDALNDPDIRWQMLWSDPSTSDYIPAELQAQNARFPYGRMQFRSFMERIGMNVMIRGHEKIEEGYKRVYDERDMLLINLFSAGGATNEDIPPDSSYRRVRPMAMTIRAQNGVQTGTFWEIDWQDYNRPELNVFMRSQPEIPFKS